MLEVSRRDGGECWLRTMGAKRVVTVQKEGHKGILVERLGILEFRFRLVACPESLSYCQESFGFRLGPLHLPVPHWMAPQVKAQEKPSTDGNLSAVSVTIRAPLAGLVVKYFGELGSREES